MLSLQQPTIKQNEKVAICEEVSAAANCDLTDGRCSGGACQVKFGSGTFPSSSPCNQSWAGTAHW
jgi:hypothetical protein